MMMRSLGGPAVARRPMGAGVPPAGHGRPVRISWLSLHRRATGRQPYPAPVLKACDNFRLPGRTVRLRLPGQRHPATAPGHAIRLRLPPGTAIRLRLPGRAVRLRLPASRRRRVLGPTDAGVGYGSGYGGWYGPSASAEPWTDGDGGIPG